MQLFLKTKALTTLYHYSRTSNLFLCHNL